MEEEEGEDFTIQNHKTLAEESIKSAIVAGSLHVPIPEENPEEEVHQYAAWNSTSTLLAVTSDTHNYVTIWNVPNKVVVARIEACGTNSFCCSYYYFVSFQIKSNQKTKPNP